MPKTKQQWFELIGTTILYAFMFGWQFGLLLTITLWFHENCHLYMAKRLGYSNSGIRTLPFIGMVALINGPLANQKDNVRVSLAGPIGGGIGALVVTIAYLITKEVWIGSAACFMFAIQLFNLIPCGSILDAGRVADAITLSINKTLYTWFNIVSTILLTLFLLKVNIFLAVFIAFIGGKQSYSRYRSWKAEKHFDYSNMEVDYFLPPKPLTKKEIIYSITAWATTVIVLSTSLYLLLSSNSHLKIL